MELCISAFFEDVNPHELSASRAELGENAGKITWENAMRDAAEREPALLDNDDKLEAFRAFIKGFGAWDADEIAAMSPTHCNALLAQFIAGDMREAGFGDSTPDDAAWAEYERRASDGAISSRLFRGDDGAIYFDMSE